MRRFLLTLFLGSLFATLGEYLFCVLVRQDVGDYLSTLGAYPLILALAWLPMMWIEQRASTPLAADVSAYLSAGLTGLAIEWFIIGNSPWRNPEANDLGMFCYWAVVLAMPRLMLDARPHLRGARLGVAIYFPIYAALAFVLGLNTPQPMRLFVLAWVVVLGYTGMNLFLARAIFLEWRHTRREALPLQEPSIA